MEKELKEFSENADIFKYEGVLPYLKKRGWALLNVALWWKQYMASSPAVPLSHVLPGRVPSAIQPGNLPRLTTVETAR
jgi:hypothetical protein